MSQSKARKARRAAKDAGVPPKKDPTYTLKSSDIERIKKEAASDAMQKAVLLMLGLPVMVLHDKFGFGNVRNGRFIDLTLDLFEEFMEDRISFEDIENALQEEGDYQTVRDIYSQRKQKK